MQSGSKSNLVLFISGNQGDSCDDYFVLNDPTRNLEYLGLLFLGVVPTIIGHNAIYYSVKYVSPTIVSAFPLGEPIIATILAFFIFGEAIGISIYIGGSITLLGLILITLKNN